MNFQEYLKEEYLNEARKLTAQQKKELETLAKEGISLVDDIPADIWKKIEAMNDYETLWQDADRMLMDIAMNKAYGTGKKE